MNGTQDTIPGKDVPRPSSLGLGWDEFSRELAEFFASIKPAMFLCKRMGAPETFITDQQGVCKFPDLVDGVWTIKVEMLGFSPLTQEVIVAPNGPASMWDLKVKPFEEIDV